MGWMQMPPIRPIHTWHKVVAGFLQNEGTPNGCVRIWRDIDVEHGGSPDVRVDFHSWKDNPSAIAEQIWRLRPESTPPTVYIYAYSWGCYTSSLICKELQRRGINVEWVVFSDPVYRHWYIAGQWRAIVPGTKIHITGNVENLHYFHQNEPFIVTNGSTQFNPRGHEVVGPRSVNITSELIEGTIHTYMDDLEKFHEMCMDVARGDRWRR